MNRTGTRRTVRTTHHTRRPSLSPYYLDDTAFTLAEILRDQRVGRFSRQTLMSEIASRPRITVVPGRPPT